MLTDTYIFLVTQEKINFSFSVPKEHLKLDRYGYLGAEKVAKVGGPARDVTSACNRNLSIQTLCKQT